MRALRNTQVTRLRHPPHSRPTDASPPGRPSSRGGRQDEDDSPTGTLAAVVCGYGSCRCRRDAWHQCPGLAAKSGMKGLPTGAETANNLSLPALQIESANSVAANRATPGIPVLGVRCCMSPGMRTENQHVGGSTGQRSGETHDVRAQGGRGESIPPPAARQRKDPVKESFRSRAQPRARPENQGNTRRFPSVARSSEYVPSQA